MDKELQDAIIRSIQTEGAASQENKRINVVLASRMNFQHLQHILNHSSGQVRIKSALAKSFQLVISQPPALSALSPLSLRCSLCGRIVSYPAWYLVIEYAVNQFHYFVCFDPNKPNSPSTQCYRRMG